MILKDLLKFVDFSTTIDLCSEDFFQLRLFIRQNLIYEHVEAFLEKEILDVTVNDNCLLIRICND